MHDWDLITHTLGYKSKRKMFIDLYAKTWEDRKEGKYCLRGLAKLLNVSITTVRYQLGILGITRASVGSGAPHGKPYIEVPYEKFGFKLEGELYKNWRFKKGMTYVEIQEKLSKEAKLSISISTIFERCNKYNG